MSADVLTALVAKWRKEAAEDQRVSFCADELEAALRVVAPQQEPPTNSAAPADREPFVDTPLKAAIRKAFDYPTVANIEAVARAAQAAVWAGLMAGFTPAPTDRTSTGTFDQGGPVWPA